MTFLLYIILYVSEVQPPVIHWIDILTAIWIISYTFRDIGTGIPVKSQIQYIVFQNITMFVFMQMSGNTTYLKRIKMYLLYITITRVIIWQYNQDK